MEGYGRLGTWCEVWRGRDSEERVSVGVCGIDDEVVVNLEGKFAGMMESVDGRESMNAFITYQEMPCALPFGDGFGASSLL